MFNLCLLCLWLCPWKEVASTRTRGEVFKEVVFSRPWEPTWLATRHWLPGSQLCSRALRLFWETMKSYPGTNPDRCLGIEPATPTLQVGEITKSSPRRTHCKLWLGARRHCCRRRKNYICPAPPLHQPPKYPPKLGWHTLALQGMPPSMTQLYFAHLAPLAMKKRRKQHTFTFKGQINYGIYKSTGVLFYYHSF